MSIVPYHKISKELGKLVPSAIIELYQLKLTPEVNGVEEDTTLYFHAGANEVNTGIVFDNQTYDAAPCKIEGFEATTKGVLPRPVFAVANANARISYVLGQRSTVFGNNAKISPLKAELARIRTCKKFLDADNFADGNLLADPRAVFNPDPSHPSGSADIWFIDRVSTESINKVEFELTSKLDLTKLRLPSRQILEFCPWKYKGEQCGYRNENGFYDINDGPCGEAQDECGKRYNSCIVRFGNEVDLPFGGFPGARLQM